MEFLIILTLILINAILAMSETALIASKKSNLEKAAKRGDRKAIQAIEHLENPGKFLSTVQIGITLIGIFTGIYSGENIRNDLTLLFNKSALLSPFSHELSTLTLLLLLTFFTLVFGELVPKRIGLYMPHQILQRFALPMRWLSRAAAPLVFVLTRSADFILGKLGFKDQYTAIVTEDEIRALVRSGSEHGSIEEIEKDIVERVFSLGDRSVSSLMTHRSEIILIRPEYDKPTLIAEVSKQMHSMYPVVDHKMHVVGMVYLKDLFQHIYDIDFSLTSLIRTPKYLSETMSAYETLILFKKERIHRAIVVDEYGEMQGVITLHDFLDALVGNIADYYEKEFTCIQRDDGSWLMDGMFPYAEFLLRFNIDGHPKNQNHNTVAGLLMHELKKVPKTGDVLYWNGIKIEIIDMDGPRIDKILLTL